VPLNNRTFGKRSQIVQPQPPPASVREVPDVDARGAPRKRTLLKGMLSYGKACEFTVDCIIADISEAGARVQIQPGPPTPTELYLVHLRERVAYESTVAWRRGNNLGLKFVSKHELEKAESPDLKVLRQHCIEYDLR
jgi:hypothetical protein